MQPSDLPQFHTDLFVPHYRPMRHGDWELRISAMNLVPGYWSGTVLVRDMAALLRHGQTWMSMTPYEIESQEIGVRLSHGHVLIFGLGMGWSAAASALREEVAAVTVVERDPDVIALYRTLAVEDQLPPAARAKIRIVEGDAYAYRPELPVDLLMPDIWYPLVSDGRVAEVGRMQANVGAGAIYFWGQEMEIARHAVAAGRAVDPAGIAATIADFGLPLIGPAVPGYAGKVALVSARWMRGRWLP
jgi:voltage-gated potassium channel Kch